MAADRIIPVRLRPAEYAELQRRATAETRTPIQQAQYIVKSALKPEAPPTNEAES